MLTVKKIYIVIIGLTLFSCVTNNIEYKSQDTLQNKEVITLVLGENGDIKLNSPLIPGITINGTLEIDGKSTFIYIMGARLFSNWNHGWTEGFYEASGKYLLIKSTVQNEYIIRQVDPVELWGIVSGEIRYFDKYYRLDDGTWKVKNRVDRLKEYSRVLKEEFGTKSSYDNSFKKNVYPRLFPELFSLDSIEKKDLKLNTVKGSNINWSIDYTETNFPNQLWELRNSGTIYRDVQEAPNLFYSIYNLDEFIKNILKDHKITKVKG